MSTDVIVILPGTPHPSRVVIQVRTADGEVIPEQSFTSVIETRSLDADDPRPNTLIFLAPTGADAEPSTGALLGVGPAADFGLWDTFGHVAGVLRVMVDGATALTFQPTDDVLAMSAGLRLLVTGSTQGDALSGANGSDVLDGRGGADHLSGLGGNDRLILGSATDLAASVVDGGAGIDTLRIGGTGGVIVDSDLRGVSGVEVLSVGDGHWSVTLGEAARAAFTGGVARVFADGATDGLDVTVAATGFRLRAQGGEGDDSILGGAGNDLMLSGGGKDTMVGGAGRDTFVFGADLTADDHVDGGKGYDTLRFEGGVGLRTAEADTLAADQLRNVRKIEEIAIGPTTHAVNLHLEEIGRDPRYDHVFSGRNVVVDAGEAGTYGVSVTGPSLGSKGSFTYVGSAGHDLIVAGSGHATLTGGLGADDYAFFAFVASDARITDFRDGEDHFVSLGATEVDPAMMAAMLASAQDTPDGLRITYGAATITVMGLTKAHFGADDFSFIA